MIINTHAHIGESRVFDHTFSEQELIEGMDKYGVDVSIVQPLQGPKGYRKYHDQIADVAARHAGRIFGMTAHSPHIDRDEYFAEVERCVKELGFVGMKLHPLETAVNPISVDGGVAFEAAQEFQVPLMIHTGAGEPFSNPVNVIPRAKQYPNVDIILAHAGLVMCTAEAILAAELCDNVYLEPSWCPGPHIGEMIEKLGSHRMMMGSDWIINLPVELLKIDLLELDEKDKNNVLSGTALKVFKLKGERITNYELRITNQSHAGKDG